MVDQIFTRATLTHYVKTQLNPNRARLYRNGQRARHCSTGIISNIKLDDGKIVSLTSHPDGRVGAVYIRVSKPKQADYKNQGDSFSPDFQIWNCAMYFINRGEQFIVFTDAGLSGADPIDNSEIMKSMWAARAKNYGAVFNRILLKDHTTNYTPSEMASMRTYRNERLNRLRNGGLMDMPFSQDEEVLAVGSGGILRQGDYRPGLTVLIEQLSKVHTIAVIDMSRLARSQFLFQVLTQMFSTYKVEIIGVTQDIDLMRGQGDRESDLDDEFDYNPDSEMGKTVGTFFLTLIAQYRVNEALLGSMRGIVQMLKLGCPHSKVPFWIKRIKPAQRKRAAGMLTEDGLLHQDDDLFGEQRLIEAEVQELAQSLVEQAGEKDDAPAFVVTLPAWMKTDYVYVDPIMLDIAHKMVTWYLDEDDGIYGLGAVAERLNLEVGIDKYGHSRSHEGWAPWTQNDVGSAFANMAMIGVQPVFGLEWRVFPPILIRKDINGKPILGSDGRPQADVALFERLAAVRKRRANEGAGRPPKNPEGYLLQGLIRCHCGRLLRHYPNPDKSGKDYYQCVAKKAERDAFPEVTHVMLREDDTDRFVEMLVRHHRRSLLDMAALRDRGDVHYQEIQRLRDELEMLEHEVIAARAEKRSEAEGFVETVVKLKPNHPRYLEQVDSMLGSLMLEYQDRQENMVARIQRAVNETKRIIPGEEGGTIEERLTRWETMTVPEKRRTLHGVIWEIRVEGEPPNEYLSIVGHDGGTPVTVRLKTEVRLSNRGPSYLRRLPSLEEWGEQVIANTLAPAEAIGLADAG